MKEEIVTDLDPLTRYWVEGWSSYRAIAVLDRRAPEDLNHIVAFMAVTLRTAFGQLRAAIEEKGGEEASWLHPELTLYYELPFAMTLGRLQNALVGRRRNCPKHWLQLLGSDTLSHDGGPPFVANPMMTSGRGSPSTFN